MGWRRSSWSPFTRIVHVLRAPVGHLFRSHAVRRTRGPRPVDTGRRDR
ncbi:respiratory nitrate reductase subunit gamma [Nocardiopsis sp. N85]